MRASRGRVSLLAKCWLVEEEVPGDLIPKQHSLRLHRKEPPKEAASWVALDEEQGTHNGY
jgi:hypothetical protein